jgi:hypothetical protein
VAARLPAAVGRLLAQLQVDRSRWRVGIDDLKARVDQLEADNHILFQSTLGLATTVARVTQQADLLHQMVGVDSARDKVINEFRAAVMEMVGIVTKNNQVVATMLCDAGATEVPPCNKPN